MKTRALFVFAALTLTLGTAIHQPAANAAPTTEPPPPVHTPAMDLPGFVYEKVPAVAQGHVLGTRNATQADVDSGFAASTTSTIWICHGTQGIYNAHNTLPGGVPNYDGLEGIKLGWEETLTSSGRSAARISTGNAIFVFSNHTTNPGTQYFDEAEWIGVTSPTGHIKYADTLWATRLGIGNSFNAGGQVGINVLSSGEASTASGQWRNWAIYGAGWRNYLTNEEQLGIYAILDVHVASISGGLGSRDVLTDLYIDANGSTGCGRIVRTGGTSSSVLP